MFKIGLCLELMPAQSNSGLLDRGACVVFLRVHIPFCDSRTRSLFATHLQDRLRAWRCEWTAPRLRFPRCSRYMITRNLTRPLQRLEAELAPADWRIVLSVTLTFEPWTRDRKPVILASIMAARHQSWIRRLLIRWNNRRQLRRLCQRPPHPSN